VTQPEVEDVLAGRLPYDELDDLADQAAVREFWRKAIDSALVDLDLRARFIAEGRRRWSEADADGVVSVHEGTCSPNVSCA